MICLGLADFYVNNHFMVKILKTMKWYGTIYFDFNLI